MTFTEAAIEVLRRAGKPLHFKEIASEAMTSGLLSHVGQTPEATMGARLLSMARREHERKVTTTDTGIFALAEWGLVHEPTALDKVQVDERHGEGESPYRPKERHPALQDELSSGSRRDDRRRRSEQDDEGGHKKKRYAPPADVAHVWLRERGQPASLAELAQALRVDDKIAEALERDLPSLERALQEENRRRTDSSRPPLFRFEADGRVTGLELPKESPRERPERTPAAKPEKPRREEVRPPPTSLEEHRRTTLKAVRRRLGSLDPASLERAATAFMEATGYRELNMTRRSAKDGPLYLARHKWGAGELRYAVRILKPGRDLGRQEVQELRKDLSHFSAQIGLLIGTGECSREAKSESNAPNTAPVMLYGGEALAEAMAEVGLGVTKSLVEWIEYDEEFFTSVGGEALPAVAEMDPVEPAAPAPAAPAPAAPVEATESREDRGRKGRDRRRDRRPREDGSTEEAPPSASSPEAATAESEPSRESTDAVEESASPAGSGSTSKADPSDGSNADPGR
jgi:ribonuclease E